MHVDIIKDEQLLQSKLRTLRASVVGASLYVQKQYCDHLQRF